MSEAEAITAANPQTRASRFSSGPGAEKAVKVLGLVWPTPHSIL